MTDLERLDACIATIRALRVLRWCQEWPSAHPESPGRPRFVREFEAQHGPAPESAERVVDPRKAAK